MKNYFEESLLYTYLCIHHHTYYRKYTESKIEKEIYYKT